VLHVHDRNARGKRLLKKRLNRDEMPTQNLSVLRQSAGADTVSLPHWLTDRFRLAADLHPSKLLAP